MSLSLLKRIRAFTPRLRPQPGPAELRIGLCEDRIFLSDGRVFPLQAEDGQPAWRAAVEALPGIISASKGEKASIVIADQFIRYALLPWSDTLKTHAQWLSLAAHRFGAIHGPVAADWEIKFAETAPAGPRLACAIDRELIDALAERFFSCGARLVSVQPFLVAAFNRVRHTTGGSCWLLVEEPGRLTLALFLHGVWVAIRSRRCGNSGDFGWRSSLPEIIARESAFLGLDEPCTRVIVCAQGSFDVTEHEAFRTDALRYDDLALGYEAPASNEAGAG